MPSDNNTTPLRHPQSSWERVLGNAARMIGKELHGPCPLCGGDDRFRVMGDGRFFCRVCCPDGTDHDRVRRIREAAFPPAMRSAPPRAAKDKPPPRINADVKLEAKEAVDVFVGEWEGRAYRYRPSRGWHDGQPDGTWRHDPEGLSIREAVRERLLAGAFARGTRVGEVERMLQAALPDREEYDALPHLAGLPGDRGVLNLDTGDRYDADPDERVSLRLGVVPDSQCDISRWKRFLAEVMPDQECAEFLRRFLGYCMTGHNREHKFLYLQGVPRSGKGTLIRAILAIMGEYGATLPADALTSRNPLHPEWLAGLDKRRVGVINDLPAGAGWRTDLINTLTGGDSISAHFMRMNSFSFTPVLKPILAGNHKPILRNTAAFGARLLLLPFTRSFQGREDRTLDDHLREELPGIAWWMVEGAMVYLEEGLGDAPGAMRDEAEQYLADEDKFGEWEAARIALSPGAWTSGKALLADYNSFAAANMKQATRIYEHFSGRAKREKKRPAGSGKKTSPIWGLSGVAIATDAEDFSLAET